MSFYLLLMLLQKRDHGGASELISINALDVDFVPGAVKGKQCPG
jgi:hypothetical protein